VAHLPSPPFATFFYGHDIGVACLSYAAWAAWWCGYAQQARQRSQAALALAHALAHPFSLAFAHIQAAIVHQFHHEIQAAQEQATAVMILAHEQGFALWHAVGTILYGWCLGMQGQSASGLAQIRQGLDALQTLGTKLMQPYLLALLAEACGAAQQPEAGLTALAEGLTGADQTGEHWYDAELYRLRGELRLQQDPRSPEAESEILHALTLARQQSTKSLELRAVVSLSRLWQSQGKRDAVRQLLEETSRWCAEGVETAILPEALALKAALL